MTHTEKIRALNIAFWRNPVMNGRLMMSSGVADRDALFHHRCIAALATYDAWTQDNDPHGEADMCVLDVQGETVWAKLDYYDRHDQNFGSEDPADPAKTLRIGTLMLPEEY